VSAYKGKAENYSRIMRGVLIAFKQRAKNFLPYPPVSSIIFWNTVINLLRGKLKGEE
jgi:hypothetical protein